MALALMTTAMLLMVATLHQQPRVAERIRAGDMALRAIESALETLRSDPTIPLTSGLLSPPAAYPAGVSTLGLRLELVVEPTGVPDLFAVAIEARYTVLRQAHRRSIETMMWRPE